MHPTREHEDHASSRTNDRRRGGRRVEQPSASTAAPLAPDDPDIVATVAAIPAGSCHARHVSVTDPQAWEPDPACTPGATDGGLPLAQLCPVAHTRPIRPPAAYTDALKRAQMRAYGDIGPPANFEEDHLIPLALGGAPRNPQNLWPEPHPSPNEKDTVEGAAHDAVRREDHVAGCAASDRQRLVPAGQRPQRHQLNNRFGPSYRWEYVANAKTILTPGEAGEGKPSCSMVVSFSGSDRIGCVGRGSRGAVPVRAR